MFTVGDKKQKLDVDQPLSAYVEGKTDQLEVIFKDLGPQISWKQVFLIEYFGPLLIHPAINFMVYGNVNGGSVLQNTLMWMVILHFIKRELETLFVHRFSHATMPFLNVFKNSFHYWLLSGFWLAFDIYAPKSLYLKFLPAQLQQLQFFDIARINQLHMWHLFWIMVWLWAEFSNLSTHIILKNLRPAGSRVRKIPHGYGFSAPFNLSCPNYYFESLSWFAFCMLCSTYSVGAWVFLLVSSGQMYAWAQKKHKNYLQEFEEYKALKRTPMFPFIR